MENLWTVLNKQVYTMRWSLAVSLEWWGTNNRFLLGKFTVIFKMIYSSGWWRVEYVNQTGGKEFDTHETLLSLFFDKWMEY